MGNRYRLGRKIGSGSFGDIYIGVCLKVPLRLDRHLSIMLFLHYSLWTKAECCALNPFSAGPAVQQTIV